jgi:hypothetical protein
MLGEFARRIDAEMQLLMKSRKHEEQQRVCGSANAPPPNKHRKDSAAVGAARAPAAAGSEGKR